MKHTPAPWIVDLDPEIDGFLSVYTTGKTQAEIAGRIGELGNASLIAAAPELLDALKDCLSELNQLAFLQGDNLAIITIHKAIEVIAKAEGK